MDSLTYRYERIDNIESGANYKKNTNKLRWVDDAINPTTTYDDIDDQDLNNYEYDDIGNLVKDDKGNIDTILWTVYGKVSRVIKKSGYDDLEFLYDATGNRIAKIVKPYTSKADTATWKTTWYMRDATGNVMATYEHKVQSSTDKFTHKEQMLYGSSRLGIDTSCHELLTYHPSDTVYRMLGRKHFEGTNHLGNVLSVVTDRRVPVDVGSNGTIDYYHANVLSSTDYYAFGMAMPGRTFYSPEYRYGFNGQEKVDELNGDYIYQHRVHDPRLGRFLSIDPLSADFPNNSPYAFSENRVLDRREMEGLESILLGPIIDPFGLGSKITNWFIGGVADGGAATINHVTTGGVGVSNAATVYVPQTFGFQGGNKIHPIYITGSYADGYDLKKMRWGSYEAQQQAYQSTGEFTSSAVLGIATDGLLSRIPVKVTPSMRKNLASQYYNKAGINSADRIAEHTAYYDFDLPVQTKRIAETTKLVQYRLKDAKGAGDYYAPLNTSPDEIGLAAEDIAETYIVTVGQKGASSQSLVSTHAKGQPLYYDASRTSKGGGKQIYNPEIKKDATFEKVDNPQSNTTQSDATKLSTGTN